VPNYFSMLHSSLHELYHGPGCTCGCQIKQQEASLALGKPGEKVLQTALKAFECLFKRKGYKPEDLGKVKEYKKLIEATNAVLKPTVTDNVVDGSLRKSLQEDVFLFSGLKTHAQLFEASRLLTNDRGLRKSFSEFEQDFQRLQSTYNSAWLEAEFNFSNAAATMADKWNRMDDDPNFDLQYRTADDERVRQSHEVLHNTTLPKEDPFWDSYYPPNGWNCRCTAIEIRVGSHKRSDPLEASQKGEKATTQIGKDGVNKSSIFRFNPGKQKVIFPPKHPYRRVQGAEEVSTHVEKVSDNKPEFSALRKTLIDKFVKSEARVLRPELNAPITFTTKGIKEALNQPHEFITEKNSILERIDEVIKNSKYLGAKEDHKKNQMVSKIHIFETKIASKNSFLIARELKTGQLHFYSISDSPRVKIGIKK